MTDDAMERVPDEIGEGPEWEWDQSEKAAREGYAAFLVGDEPATNPYRDRPGDNFSGYKRRKRNDWYKGWQLAAIREGDCDSPDEVLAKHGLNISLPRAPEQALYENSVGSGKAADDVGEWGYRFQSTIYPTRHDAIGMAAVHGRQATLTDPRKALNGVATVRRLRRPQLPEEA